MIGNKLQIAMKSLSKEDKKSLLLFLQSPYFNKKTELVTFYSFLLETKNIKYEKTYLCNNIFSKPINVKELGYLFSDLMKQIEDFLIVEQFKKTEHLDKRYILQQYQKRNLNKLFNQKKTQFKKNEPKIKNVDYFLHKFHEHEIYELFQIYNEKQRLFDPNNQLAVQFLDKYFILKKLMLFCSIISKNTLVSGEFELTFLDEIMSQINIHNLREEPVIDIYYTMVQMLMSKNDKDTSFFNHLNHLVETKSHYLPQKEVYEIYLHLINYCLQKIRIGQKKFVKNALSLYKIAIESGVFLNNNSLSPWRFNNVIKLAIIDNQFVWAKEFIEENKEKLPKEFRNDAINYNLAQLLYNENKYDEALIYLNLLKHTDFSYRLGSREILAKIYYEKNEEEALLSLIASFTIFLKRNKNISSNLKVPFLNFCDLLNQILRRNPKKLQKVKEKIIATKVVTSKSWLLSTIEKEIKKLNLPIK